MGGRIYDPRLARVLQVDPVVSNLLSSQRWNAYSYVLNNPLRYVDPTGFDESSGGGTGGAGGGADAGGTGEASMPPEDNYSSGAMTADVGAPGPLVMPVDNGSQGSDHQPAVDEQPQPASEQGTIQEPFRGPSSSR